MAHDLLIDILVQPFPLLPYLCAFCRGVACRAGLDMRVSGVSFSLAEREEMYLESDNEERFSASIVCDCVGRHAEQGAPSHGLRTVSSAQRLCLRSLTQSETMLPRAQITRPLLFQDAVFYAFILAFNCSAAIVIAAIALEMHKPLPYASVEELIREVKTV